MQFVINVYTSNGLDHLGTFTCAHNVYALDALTKKIKGVLPNAQLRTSTRAVMQLSVHHA